MPIIRVCHPERALDEAHKADLVRRLTEVLIAMEGGADTWGGRAFAWVLFAPVRSEDWWIGGRQDDHFVGAAGRFLVHVTVPEGYMNARQKTEVHARFNDAVMAAMDATGDPDAGRSVLVVIDEVPEGNWGAAGQTISLSSIAATVGLAKDGDRFAWVQSYFAAKRRQFEAAGYPTDASGLMAPVAAEAK